jgi:hypothetical protein
MVWMRLYAPGVVHPRAALGRQHPLQLQEGAVTHRLRLELHDEILDALQAEPVGRLQLGRKRKIVADGEIERTHRCMEYSGGPFPGRIDPAV